MKKKTEHIARLLGEGLIVVNQIGEPVFMNPAAERLLGVKVDQMKGKSILEHRSGEQVVSLWTRGPGPAKEAIQVSGKRETKSVLRASRAVIQSEDGELVGLVSALPHVTRAKELELMKEGFVGSVTHELRTPLHSINEAVNLLLEKVAGDLTPKQEKLLVVAQRNVRRLSGFISDLLDLSDIETGEFKLRISRFRVDDLLRSVHLTFQSWAKSKRLTFQVEKFDSETNMEGDRDRLHHVLDHLVSNAMKFTPEAGIIKVEAREAGSSPKSIEFRVQDTGPGIPKEEKERIFERFTQIESLRQTVVTGAGLGLAISKIVVERHGGQIAVESTQGKGSCFYFKVPRFQKGSQKRGQTLRGQTPFG